jgi:hypothetical protein
VTATAGRRNVVTGFSPFLPRHLTRNPKFVLKYPIDQPQITQITRISRIEIGSICNFSEVANGEKIQTENP